ncbi:MAG: acyl-CoA thioesterase [Prevotellaceae bacterium]|jgi:acyl-CoA thioester hydrolase|nr:acyl-CoA thioesterase [Prevotellaceae bacterium]
MEEIIYNHSIPIQIRFNDVDKFGHVNNSVYFTYCDLGKSEYFAAVSPDMDLEQVAVVMVHIEADFLSQIILASQVSVQTAVTRLGNKSMNMEQRVINEVTGEVKFVCRSTLVAFDLHARASIEIPATWRDAISRFEHRTYLHEL